MTAMRVTSLYDLMDNAYDAAEIKAHSRSLGHVPIIAPHPRGTVRKAEQLAEAKRRRSTGWYPPEDLRYQQRGAAERVNASFKDNFAGRLIRLRGADKIECHCLLALTAIAAGARSKPARQVRKPKIRNRQTNSPLILTDLK